MNLKIGQHAQYARCIYFQTPTLVNHKLTVLKKVVDEVEQKEDTDIHENIKSHYPNTSKILHQNFHLDNYR